jgi:uncharacterized protein DUF4388
MDHRSFHLAAVHELVGTGEGWTSVLSGDLSGLPISDLLHVLSQGHRTGLLLVRGDDDSERALGFSLGEVSWAASSEPAERDALGMAFGLVRLQDGWFTFLRGPVPAGEGPSGQELVLEGLRRLDEAQRLAG